MPKQAGETQPTQRQISPGVGQWQWADGTPLTQDEVSSFGLKNAGNAGNFFDDVGQKIGFNPTLLGENTATLDTSGADAQRKLQGDFVSALQQQAATGDGAWQQRFADAVRSTKANASSLGQADSSADYGASRLATANARNAAQQRSVGEGEMLRAQSQLDAMNQLGTVLPGMGQADIQQAAERARVSRERQAANQASIDQTGKNRESTEKGITSIFSMGMSDGGRVPGRAKVFGNDERNDTQAAMLSPGEIVIPRDIALSPDAPEQAARFVAAVKAGHNPQANGGNPRKFAEGGQAAGTALTSGSMNDVGKNGGFLGYFIEPHIGRTMQYDAMRGMYGQGGGELDTAPYRQTAGQMGSLASLFAGSAAGKGPSLAPAMQQQRTDDDMVAGLNAQNTGGASMASVLNSAAKSGINTAGDVGRQVGRETSAGQSGYGRLLSTQRGQEMQLASAQQQAAFQKALADMGINLDQQAAIRGSIGAAGQGAAAFAAQGRGQGGARSAWDTPDTGYLGDGAGPEYRPEALSGGDFPEPDGDAQYAAYGGVIGMADGGEIEADLELSSGQKVKFRGEPMAPKRRELTDVMHSKTPQLLPDEIEAQRKAEYEEETDSEYRPRKPKKPTEQESRFAKAVRAATRFARKAGSMVRGYAEGGGVGADGGQHFFDPYAYDVRRDTGPVVYVSPTPVPGTQPLPLGGAGGGGGSDVGAAGAGGGTSLAESAAAMGGTGGMSGATPMDRGSAGATGGPAGNQIPQHEAIQPRAERPAVASALPAGVMPKGAPPPVPDGAPKPDAARPAAMGTPRPSGAKADELAREAARQGYDAERLQNAAAAREAHATADAIESQMNERKELVARTQQKVEQAQTRYQQAVDEMSRVDTSVDPGRFWASRTTGDKVIGIMGLVLGALGAGPDGVNRAAVMLNDAVNRDLEAQKSEHELRLKKGGAKLNASQNFYAMAREMAGDEVAASDLAHAAALQAVVAKGKALMAQTKDAEAKARLAALVASIEQGAAQRAGAAWEKAADRALEREKIAAASHGGRDATATKDLRNAVAANKGVEDLVGDLKALISDTNFITEKAGTRSAAMESAAALLLTKIKEQEKLGALDKGTTELAEKLIGDPTATFTTDASKIAKLDTLLKQSRRDVRNLAGAMQ
jgi:hypothetical protein